MSSQRKRFGKTRRHFSRRMPAFSLPGSTPSRTIYQHDPSVIASRFNSPVSVSVLHGDQKIEKVIN